MGRSKRRRDLPGAVEDMTVEQLRSELAYWRMKVRVFGVLQANRNRKECLKRVRRIEKLLVEKSESRT
jgi:hypothetical protein